MNLNTHDSAEPVEDPSATAGETTDGAEMLITEPRKPINASAVTLFAIIAIGAAGTYFMHLKTGPQSAGAAVNTGPSATETVTGFLADGGKTMKTMRLILQGTQKLVEQFKSYPSVSQVPLTDLKANPFHLSTTQLPAAEETAEAARKKREEQKLAALGAAQSLKLQSLMSRGSRRMVMINNAMYQEGDSVDGFVIEKITSNSVVVKHAPFRFELTMAR